MRTPHGVVLIVAVMLGSTSAHSASRLVLRGFSAIENSAVREQLETAVCQGLTCVSEEEGTVPGPTGAALLHARVEKGKQYTSVLLDLITQADKPEKSWRLTIRKGRLSDPVLAGVAKKVRAAVAKMPSPAASMPNLMSGVPLPGAKPPPKQDLMTGVPAPSPKPAVPEALREEVPAAENRASEQGVDAKHAEQSTAPKAERAPWVALEAGLGIFNRDLRFFGRTGAGVERDYDGRFLLSPYVRLGVYPLSWVSKDWLKTVSLYIDFQRGVGGTFVLPNGAAHPMIYQRLDIETIWRIPVVAGFGVGPEVGYRSGRFLLGLAADGSPLANLPGVSENGLYFGLNMAWAFQQYRQLTLTASGHYQPRVRLGELAQSTYFPMARASALEAKLGLSFLLAGPVHVVFTGTFTRISAALNPTTSAARQAKGAADRFVTVRLGIRAVF